jgi:hypothetical protein
VRANYASLKSGMLACSYLHGSTVAMCHPRRLCPFAVKKRIEAVQNSTHPSGSVRRPVPQEIGERPFPSE